jgi:hypothetical protein
VIKQSAKRKKEEWWSNGVMKGLNEIVVLILAFSKTPTLQCSITPKQLVNHVCI